jgi:hypothetical protein
MTKRFCRASPNHALDRTRKIACPRELRKRNEGCEIATSVYHASLCSSDHTENQGRLNNSNIGRMANALLPMLELFNLPRPSMAAAISIRGSGKRKISLKHCLRPIFLLPGRDDWPSILVIIGSQRLCGTMLFQGEGSSSFVPCIFHVNPNKTDLHFS